MDASEVEIQRQFNEREEESVYRKLAQKKGQILVQLAGEVEAESLLDVGSRYGDTLLTVHDLMPTLKLTAVDIVPEFLEDTREAGIESIEADAANLPFTDQAFDIVFCSHTLEHCKETLKAFTELLRTTKKFLYLVVPYEDQKHFDDNASHHFHAGHPVDWWLLYDKADPERKFLPTFFRTSSHADIEILFMRIPE